MVRVRGRERRGWEEEIVEREERERRNWTRNVPQTEKEEEGEGRRRVRRRWSGSLWVLSTLLT